MLSMGYARGTVCRMPILTRKDEGRGAVQCIREMHIGIPIERLGDIEDFYRGVLGLRPWPTACQISGGWGVGEAHCGVLFEFRHDPRVEPMRRRLALTVPGLDAVAKRLCGRNWPFVRRRGLGYSDHCILVADPVGHLVELRQSRPL